MNILKLILKGSRRLRPVAQTAWRSVVQSSKTIVSKGTVKNVAIWIAGDLALQAIFDKFAEDEVTSGQSGDESSERPSFLDFVNYAATNFHYGEAVTAEGATMTVKDLRDATLSYLCADIDRLIETKLIDVDDLRPSSGETSQNILTECLIAAFDSDRGTEFSQTRCDLGAYALTASSIVGGSPLNTNSLLLVDLISNLSNAALASHGISVPEYKSEDLLDLRAAYDQQLSPARRELAANYVNVLFTLVAPGN